MMGDFVYMEEDWDLQAVIRGWTTNGTEDSLNFTDNYPSCSQENIEVKSVFDERYSDPFLPILQPLTTAATSIPVPSREAKKPENQISPKHVTDEGSKPTTSVAKSRGRKSQHKRVVRQVAADGGLSSDMWAWRKYGQKPIKGSPNPRSYYRCSSVKGCLARRQVERCSLDPTQYIITYTGEHNHTHPTRRRSLAGSTRSNKSSQHKEPSMPTTTSIQGGVPQPVIPEMEEEPTLIMEDSWSDKIVELEDMLFNDESFPCFEDFEGFFLDRYPDNLGLVTYLEQQHGVTSTQ